MPETINGTYTGAPTILGPDGRPYSRPGTAYRDGFNLPHQLLFGSLLQASWKQYWPLQFDESRRVRTPDFHLVLDRQLHLTTMLNERYLQLQGLSWSIDVEDKRDPFQLAVKEGLEQQIRGIPYFYRLLYSLQQAVWPGRSAAQLRWEWKDTLLPAAKLAPALPQGAAPAATAQPAVENRRVITVTKHHHVRGDKILYKTDHTPMISIYSPEAPNIPGLVYEPTGAGWWAAPLYGSWRTKFCIHQHWTIDKDFWDSEAQDAIHGVGVRDALAWMEWLRQEWLADIAVYMKRKGLGITLWYYDASNPQALVEVTKRAKDNSDRNNLFVPYFGPAGAGGKQAAVEVVDTPTAGMEALFKLVEHVEYWEQRLINGQPLFTHHSRTGGIGGGDAAEAQQDDRLNVLKWDAKGVAEAVTGSPAEPGIVWVMFSRTWPELVDKMPPPRFKFNVPEVATDKALEAVSTFVGLGGRVIEEEARALLPGFTAPQEGDEVLGGGGLPGEDGEDGPGWDGESEPDSGSDSEQFGATFYALEHGGPLTGGGTSPLTSGPHHAHPLGDPADELATLIHNHLRRHGGRLSIEDIRTIFGHKEVDKKNPLGNRVHAALARLRDTGRVRVHGTGSSPYFSAVAR